MKRKRVFVTGCFDMLHSGHVRFLEMAAAYGDVFVGIGSDRTVLELKGRSPLYTQQERQYLLDALKYVRSCSINSGSGVMDFVRELKLVSPNVFIVNEDGNTPAKAELCRTLGIRYVVLKRSPGVNLPVRCTTSLAVECRIPYRLDLAGGWLDQPFVSKYASGPVITACVEPTIEFNERSGMASSTRRRAIELWQTNIPEGDRAKLAKILFAYENPPGTTEFAGSQDSIGIVFPGLNRLDYQKSYWPTKISSVNEEEILQWLEKHLSLIPLGPRRLNYHPLKRRRINTASVQALAKAANGCWRGILNCNVKEFGRFCRESFEAQISMFPAMLSASVRTAIKRHASRALGWKLSGAGGGGYLVLVTSDHLHGAIKIKIRRRGI